MKKILFITYYWPPSGKASIHWPLKVIKHLYTFGWIPSVLTVDEDTFSQKDYTFLNEIPEDVKVIRAKSIEPFNVYKKLVGKSKNEQLIVSETISTINKNFGHRLSVWIRMNLFIPDARIGWYFPAVKAATDFLNKENINAIVSVGPPHTTHLIGKKIASKFSIPHIPVFIDPWVDISYYKNFKRSKMTLSIDNRLEKSVLQNSAAAIFVTETMKKDYENKYPAIKNKSYVLYWGYSEEDFRMNDLSGEALAKTDGRWKTGEGKEEVILHAGNIFDYQNPKKFWRTLKNQINNGRKLKLVFIGTVSSEIKQSIENAGLNSYTEYKGFLPYKEMLQEMMKANYLLVCATEPRHVPGKLFEYLRAGKPIIAFGDGNEEVKKIITEANAGVMFGYEESGDEFFGRSETFSTNMDLVKSFERKKITEAMIELLNSIHKR
ncbi:MAG: glycosyltransferase [Ignavibacteriaceae bacterium]|nr:glycosyltransferase [Ignavibacteriaceae bacterium]